jgi:hypothetical protein
MKLTAGGAGRSLSLVFDGQDQAVNGREEDPAGFLRREPDLKELLHHPDVAEAVSKGGYRALRRALRHLAGDHQEAGALLGSEFLFLREGGPPFDLLSVNGLGFQILTWPSSRVVGYHKGFVYLAVLFVPVLPIGVYLVTTEGGRYYFLGKQVFSRLPLVFLGVWMVVLMAGVGYQHW